MAILELFLLRLAFGLAAAMAYVSPRQVTSGYYRNHLYVLLGLNVLAALTVFASKSGDLILPLVAAGFSYGGSIFWLYEKPPGGRAVLVFIAAIDLLAAGVGHLPMWTASSFIPSLDWPLLDNVTGGLLLGATLAAMFLGHWYLNSPTMELAPLRRLVRLLVTAVLLRALVCASGLLMYWLYAVEHGTTFQFGTSMVYFLPLRWLFGIFGPLLLAWMTLRTLDIPNTQSATGILYVAVITVFTGELCSELLSYGALFPL